MSVWPSHATPTARERIGRTGAESAARGTQGRRGGAEAPDFAASIERATIAASTAASTSELLASRFAPWSPVEAALPQAQSPAIEPHPFR